MQLINATELASWLEDAKRQNPVLLDVREFSEVQHGQIPGSIHMPMNTVLSRLDELTKETPIVCICHHGARSMQVAHFLKQHGFLSVFNLTGGIHTWAVLVDPRVETY